MLASGNAGKSWRSSRVAQQLGIDYPIIQAPFRGLPSQRLTATVNLGGLGSLGAVTIGSLAIREVIGDHRQITVDNRDCHHLSQSEIGGAKRISQHLSNFFLEIDRG